MIANFLLLYLGSWQPFFFLFFLMTLVQVQKESQIHDSVPFRPDRRLFRAWVVVEQTHNERRGESGRGQGEKKAECLKWEKDTAVGSRATDFLN